MLVIGSNLQSLNAQRNLGKSQQALSRSLERLSSGSRINSARDDAAGLAISDRMQAQIRGLNQAMRNASDGVSMAQTVDGSLSEVTANLQRIRELAVQSANATNSAADRSALDAEVQQRLAEINRIADQTNFNGARLLDGSSGNVALQVGANVGETINMDLSTDLRTSSIGGSVQTLAGSSASGNDLTANAGAFGTATLATTAHKTGAGANTYGATASGAYAGVSGTALDGSNFSLNGQGVLASSGYTGSAAAQDASSAYAKAAAINASDIDGITASAQTQLSFGTTGGTTGSTDFLAMWSQGAGTNPGKIDYSLTINGVEVITYNETFATSGSIPTSLGATTIGLSMNVAVSAINAAQGSTGVSAALDADGNLQLAAADGRNIRIQESVLADVQNIHPESATVRSAFSQLEQTGWEASMTQDHTYRGQLTLSSKGNVAVAGTASAAGFIGSETLTGSNLASINVLDVSTANAAIQLVDEALTTVFNTQSRFGAIQNRLDSVVSSLGITTESLSAARSRIQDADFAQETAEMTRAQILQQAGTAMLAQANTLPQNVLNLLRQ